MADIRLMPLHSSQRGVYAGLGKRTALRCGRRWGKSALIEVIAAYDALRGRRVGLFAPDYARLTPMYGSLLNTLKPAIKSASKTEMTLTLVTGGVIDLWTLVDPNAGRSRWYDRAIVDEAGLVPDLENIFNLSIAPTLLDHNGDAILAGTPLGVDDQNFFYKACTTKTPSPKWPVPWVEFHRPTSSNPLLDPQVVQALPSQYPELVYQQEYQAEFVSWSGESLFKLPTLLVDGHGVEFPAICDGVYCTVDTAVKDGLSHDGTAVCYFAVSKYFGVPVTILDWDYVQVNAATQIEWLPSVFNRLDALAQQCRARYGVLGCYIEDKQTGSMLLQHGEATGWPTVAIPANMTAAGKSGRASMASGPVHQGRVKLSAHAYNKVSDFKGIVKNHLVAQITSFSIGDKEAYKRSDDLSDCFSYGCLIAFEGETAIL